MDQNRGRAVAARSRSASVLREPSAGERYEAIWNALPFPALTLDADNSIGDANAAAEHFFGQSAAILRRMRLDDFFREGSRVLDLIDRTRRGAPSMSEFGVELAIRDQEPQPADVQATLMFDRSERMLLIIQPRSVAASMEGSINKQGAARGLSGFSAMMAHEIKNPLAAISGAAQLLEMTLGEEENELLRLVQDEVDRIRSLLDRMDAFGATGPLDRKPVNIHDVLEQARLSAAAGYGRHVRFREFYDPSLPPVPGDRVQLLQAISNLVKNAAEAAPQGGAEVTLRTAFRPGVKIAVAGGARVSLPLEVTVMDNGSGVPEDLRPHVFDPFVTSKSSGTGLGLAVVAKIISDHGGVIEYARKDERTVFRILLPVMRETSDTPAPARGKRRAK